MNAPAKIQAGVPEVYTAISNVMAQMSKEGIGKDRKNSQQGYNFRGIDDVYNTLCGVLAANRLVILPYVQDMQRDERQTKSGGALNYTILTVDFTLVSAVDGSQAVVRMIGEAMDSADKSSNKAQSAALKYAALQVFMIPTEGDNDPDATTHEVAPRKAEKPKLDPAAKINDKTRHALQDLIIKSGGDVSQFCRDNGLTSLADLTNARSAELAAPLKAKLAAAPTPFGEILADEVPY